MNNEMTTKTAVSAIDRLVEQYAQKELAAAAEREAARERNRAQSLEMAKKAIVDQAPELWKELAPHAVGQYVTEQDGTVEKLTYTVTLPELPPFEVTAAAKKGGCYHINFEQLRGYDVLLGRPGKGGTWTIDRAGELFLILQQQLREEEQKKLEKKLNELSAKLTTSYYRVQTEEEALAVARQLDKLAPDSTDDWAGALAAWRKWYDAEQVERARRAENQRRIKAYADSFRRFAREDEAVKSYNERLLQDLQAQFDGAFTAYELSYAYFAVDPEYGGSQLDTDSVTVLSDRPDEMGYWQVLRRGQLARLRYEHVVSIEGPLQKPVVADGVRVHIDAPKYHTLFCAPGREEELEAAVSKLIDAWQERPPAPGSADYDLAEHTSYRLPNGQYYTLHDIRRQVWNEVEQEDESAQ